MSSLSNLFQPIVARLRRKHFGRKIEQADGRRVDTGVQEAIDEMLAAFSGGDIVPEGPVTIDGSQLDEAVLKIIGGLRLQDAAGQSVLLTPQNTTVPQPLSQSDAPTFAGATLSGFPEADVLIVGTDGSIDSTSTPVLDGLTLDGFTEGEFLIVGPGGVIETSGGGSGGTTLRCQATMAISTTSFGSFGAGDAASFSSAIETGGVDWWDVGDPTKITVDEAAVYQIQFQGLISASGASTISLQVRVNGSIVGTISVYSIVYTTTDASIWAQGSIVGTLAAGDDLELWGIAVAGSIACTQCRFSVVKLGTL